MGVYRPHDVLGIGGCANMGISGRATRAIREVKPCTICYVLCELQNCNVGGRVRSHQSAHRGP
jgi:hypothetical protein